MTVQSVPYSGTRVIAVTAQPFEPLRAAFEQEVPAADLAVALDLVTREASWSEVETAVKDQAGPSGFVHLARLDQGPLLSLAGRRVQATLYLVGNPVVARGLVERNALAALYAPFRLSIFEGPMGAAAIAYDLPSSVLESLGDPVITDVARTLDARIGEAVRTAIRAAAAA